jgi:hypothetical protein
MIALPAEHGGRSNCRVSFRDSCALAVPSITSIAIDALPQSDCVSALEDPGVVPESALIVTHDLRRRSSDVYDSLCRIMRNLNLEPLDRRKFNSRMNNLKKDGYGKILK